MLLGGDCETNYVSGWQRWNSTELQQTAEVTAGRRFSSIKCDQTFLWGKFSGSHFHLTIHPPPHPPPLQKKRKKDWKYILQNCVFPSIPGLQTVKFKPSNGSGCHKEGVMVLGNGVIIVIQDKDAYCHRRGMWGANETAAGAERSLLENSSFKCDLEWKPILQTVILPLLLSMFLPFSLLLAVLVAPPTPKSELCLYHIQTPCDFQLYK